MTRDCKLVILGDSQVGKTSLVHYFVNDEFRAGFKETIGAEVSSKYETIDNRQIHVLIWDTAGQERYKSITKQFFRGADACILVADLTNIQSFESLPSWLDNLLSEVEKTSDEFPIVLFANKSDLAEQRTVTPEIVERYSKAIHCQSFEVSAKTGENIEEGFVAILRNFLSNLRIIQDTIIQPVDINENSQNKSCC